MIVTAPAGWVEATAEVRQMAYDAANTSDHFGHPHTKVEIEAAVYTSPGEPKVALYVTRVVMSLATARDAAARAEVDELHDAARRAGMSGAISVDTWQENVYADAKLVDARLVYRDTSSKMRDRRRIVIAADATTIVAVTGECLSSDDAAGQASYETSVSACTSALNTLDVGIALDKRVALALAPASAEPAAPAKPFSPSDQAPPVPKRPAPAGSSAGGDDELEPPAPPTMSDGSRTPMPPIAVAPAQPSSDRRPIYVGAAIVMLGFGLWWNRRRRAQFERDDADSSGDDDADALRSAAKGEDAKPDDAKPDAAKPAAAKPDDAKVEAAKAEAAKAEDAKK